MHRKVYLQEPAFLLNVETNIFRALTEFVVNMNRTVCLFHDGCFPAQDRYSL